MSNRNGNWAVGMVHEVCPICVKELNHQIIIPKTLNKSTKADIEHADGKAIGFSEKACEECQGYIDDGYIAVIGFNESKSNPDQDKTVKLENLYRTGLFFLHRRVVEHIFPAWAEQQRKEPFILVTEPTFDEVKANIEQQLQKLEDTSEENETSEA